MAVTCRPMHGMDDLRVMILPICLFSIKNILKGDKNKTTLPVVMLVSFNRNMPFQHFHFSLYKSSSMQYSQVKLCGFIYSKCFVIQHLIMQNAQLTSFA